MFKRQTVPEAIAQNVHPNLIIEGSCRTTLIVGGLGRREKTEAEREAERKANRTTKSEIVQENRWRPEDFQAALDLGFPGPFIQYGSTYSRATIAEWREKLLKLAATLKAR